MVITWQWITNQIFAFIALIFVVLSFQQKSTKKLLILRNISTFLVFIGFCFLGNVSAIILCSVGIIRNLVTLYFALKIDIRKSVKIIASALIILLLIILNIIFWQNMYNLFSITLGTLAVFEFMQEKASSIRKIAVIHEILSIIYYSLLLSPINVLIEIVGLLSAIVGIIRLDVNKVKKNCVRLFDKSLIKQKGVL